ncbi:MAG: tRNA 2-selenouridine(34) synthase MnmH, partial [Spirochaetia bacterium]|nr:tRNA 2-selenouridine(34) synthase MnmH [Spirochaetia bacterium]
MYKQESPFRARELGARIISANIAKILLVIEEMARAEKASPRPRPFLIYCWRGGMRSKSLFTVMDMIGYKSFLLEGGYKAYRRGVRVRLASPFPVVIGSQNVGASVVCLHGFTGTGKTALMGELAKSGWPSLDLEGLANHRGSMLGMMSGGQPSQKAFEGALFEAMRTVRSPLLVVEGESRGIGFLLIPDGFFGAMESGKKLWVEIPFEERVKRSVEDYLNDVPDIIDKLRLFQDRMSNLHLDELRELLEKKRLLEAAEIMLREYYDPLYNRHGPEANPERYTAVIKARNFEDLSAQTKQWLSDNFGDQRAAS